jgi:hypothetical protein
LAQIAEKDELNQMVGKHGKAGKDSIQDELLPPFVAKVCQGLPQF